MTHFRAHDAHSDQNPRWRDRQEDSWLIRSDLGLVAVSDGVGGHAHGDLASTATVAAVWEAVSELGGAEDDPEALLAALRAGARAAHARCLALPEGRGRRAPGATLTAAVRRGSALAWLHLGDSRLYLGDGDGKARLLTRDHRLLGHALTRAVGCGDEEPAIPLVSVATVAAGSALLLCTDGTWEAAGEERVADCLRAVRRGTPPAETARDLVAQAIGRGSQDNATAAVVLL